MLAFRLDEQISPVVMDQVQQKRPDIRFESVLLWRHGDLRGKEDKQVLRAAQEENLALVTYDQKTIAPLLIHWTMEGRDHAGVIFIDDKSIAQEDIGGKVRALLSLWEQSNHLDWKNLLTYLKHDSAM
jgi:hypothetical protein